MRLRRVLHGTALVFVVSTGTGCSVIGFTAGAITDACKPDTMVASPAQVLALAPGRAVEATVSGGRIVTGEYSGPVDELGGPYGLAFARNREKLLPDHPIPKLASRVRVDGEGAYPSRKLLGMDRQHVFLNTNGEGESRRWAELESLGAERGTMIAAETLADLTALGRIPSVGGVSLRTGEAREALFFVDTHEFRVAPERGSKWRGLMLGVIGDATLAMILASPKAF